MIGERWHRDWSTEGPRRAYSETGKMLDWTLDWTLDRSRGTRCEPQSEAAKRIAPTGTRTKPENTTEG